MLYLAKYRYNLNRIGCGDSRCCMTKLRLTMSIGNSQISSTNNGGGQLTQLDIIHMVLSNQKTRQIGPICSLRHNIKSCSITQSEQD